MHRERQNTEGNRSEKKKIIQGKKIDNLTFSNRFNLYHPRLYAFGVILSARIQSGITWKQSILVHLYVRPNKDIDLSISITV